MCWSNIIEWFWYRSSRVLFLCTKAVWSMCERRIGILKYALKVLGGRLQPLSIQKWSSGAHSVYSAFSPKSNHLIFYGAGGKVYLLNRGVLLRRVTCSSACAHIEYIGTILCGTIILTQPVQALLPNTVSDRCVFLHLYVVFVHDGC